MFPLTPKAIQQTKEVISSRQKAASTIPSMQNSTPSSRIVVINTKAGFKTSPPNIRLGIGVVSSVIFTDEKGDIWPIESYVVGDSQDFTINWMQKSGILMIQSKKPYSSSNIAVMLSNRKTPITLMLQSTQKAWDYELYIRVPSGKINSLTQENQKTYLVNLLSGIKPEGAKTLHSSDPQIKVYSYQGKYLILTSSTLISPTYNSHIEDNSFGKNNVYEIAPSPIVMVSNDTGVHKIYIEDN